MKYKIYDHRKKTRKEPEVTLRLLKEKGYTYVIAVDEDGELDGAGYLICFNENGTVSMETGVSPKFGFKLNDYGAIVTE